MKVLVLQQSSANNLTDLKVKFHYIIKGGELIKGLDEMVHGNHTPGHNYQTVGVLLTGSKPLNEKNKEALKKLTKSREVTTFDKSLSKYTKKVK